MVDHETPRGPSRDDRILRHIARYRVSTREAISKRFFEGGNPGNVIQRLLREGRIVSRRGLPDNARFYQIAPKEAIARGVPLNRAKPFGPAALATHLTLLWYCALHPDGIDRGRMERSDLREFFEERAPTGDHCVEWTEPIRIVNPLVPRLTTPPRKVIARVAERAETSAAIPRVRSLSASGQYAVAVLACSDVQIERYKEALHRHERTRPIPVRVDFSGGVPAMVGA